MKFSPFPQTPTLHGNLYSIFELNLPKKFKNGDYSNFTFNDINKLQELDLQI
jgi:hypothetical protein